MDHAEVEVEHAIGIRDRAQQHPVTRFKIGGDHRFGARRGHIRLELHHHAIFALPRDHGVEQVVIDAATVCPGECIFIEEEAWYGRRGSS